MKAVKIIAAAIGWIVVIPVLAFIWFSSDGEAEREPPSEAQIERAAARNVCKDAITDLLHDPGSAEWEPMHRWVAAENEADANQFLVQTDMRARNAMGGMVRTTFQCKFAGRGEDMRLIEVTEH